MKAYTSTPESRNGSPERKSASWVRRTVQITLTGLGTVTGLATFAIPLSNILIRPRLKRLHQLRSPLLARFLQKKGYDFKPVSFRSYDGKKLHGWFLLKGHDNPTIIVLHGVKGNRTSVIRYAITLCNANFNVLVFDSRGHGESEGYYVTYGHHEKRDVESAIAFLEDECGLDPSRIGLVGLSMGAAVALQVAAMNKQVRAVWADSPFASLLRVSTHLGRQWTRLPEALVRPIARTTLRIAGLRAKLDFETVNPANIARDITCPVALVHGTADELISHDHSELIYDLLGSAEKEIWILEGASHSKCIRFGGENYLQRMVGFFNKVFQNK